MAFSEYLLYEPILRVLVHRKYKVACEAKCDYIEGRITEYKRIDFVAKKGAVHFALEVKWHRSKITTRKLNVTRDHKKLVEFRKQYPKATAFLCVFGTWKYIHALKLNPSCYTDLRMSGRLPEVYAKFKRTQYGCRVFELDK